jgi:glycosyltransferase involved in cell wall biosynthesis
MRLSVVMAVRNGSAYLRDAIESVLAQSVTDVEFLIINDASDDDTAEILSGYLVVSRIAAQLRGVTHCRIHPPSSYPRRSSAAAVS